MTIPAPPIAFARDRDQPSVGRFRRLDRGRAADSTSLEVWGGDRDGHFGNERVTAGNAR
jgi:hypothetical protein